MRSDYVLYIVAIICFIAAAYTAIINTETQLYISALVILGIIFIGLGYMARPKKVTLTAATSIPSPSPPEPPSETMQPKTELKKEEPKKPTTKTRTRKKKATRRRKKKT